MPFRAAALALALLALPTLAHAACTEKDQEAKFNELGALLTPLLQKDPARANKISADMTATMTLTGDASCAALDKLIAQAK